MRSLIFTLSCLLISSTCSGQAGEANLIYWRENIKLTWKDFQATKMPANVVGYAANSAASIKVQSFKNENNKYKYKVCCVFDKSHSWVRDTSVIFAETLLAHEQLHFNIGELFTRRIRQKLSELLEGAGNNYDQEIEKTIRTLLAEYSKTSSQYDQETHHGTLIDEQERWTNYVKTELAKVSVYKSTSGTYQ